MTRPASPLADPNPSGERGHVFAYSPETTAREVHVTPFVAASEEALRGYGTLVDEPKRFPIEIARWPATGWRPIDDHSGDQGGVAEGVFEVWWGRGTLYGRNHAVGDNYIFGWSDWPEQAAETANLPRTRALVWRANYHPDGGQLFYPSRGQPFSVALALPGDSVTPASFTTFYCDGTRGLYIHPSIWHGPIMPLDDHAELLDRQGRVHARVSVDFAKEFGCYLCCPLSP